MSRKLTSKMLAVLLAAVMVAGLLPISALAARVIRDDAPVAEVAMGDEAVKTAVKPAKAAEVEETEAETGTETGEAEYDPATDSSRDYPLQLKMLTVSGHDNQNNTPDHMLDGDPELMWVMGWGKGGEGKAAECAEDNWIQITLPKAVAVQGIRYQARYDAERPYASGGFGGWRLETSEDGVTWTNPVTGNWGVEGKPENETGDVPFEGTYYKPESSEWYYAGWDEPVETRYIRLTATQLYAYEEKNINYGSCAELRLVMAEGAKAPTEAAYDCVLAENGPVDGGVYAIFTNRAGGLDTELTMNSLLYYSGTGDVTNQVSAGAISEDADRKYLDLNHDRTFYPVETQLWQAIETEGGWLLKSLAGGRNMYLELSLKGSSAHAHAKVNYKPQTLTIEAASQKNNYKILQQDGETCCSLNWYGSGYWTHNEDTGFPLRFYRWNGEELATEADVYAVDDIADQTYTGSAIEPTVTVTKNGAEMTGGYTVEYGNNIEEGEATVTIVVNRCIVAETTFQIVAKSDPGDNENPGGETENPGTEPENPGTEPENPGTEPENPGTEPENPGTEPENPGTEPENPGTEPENPGTEPENPGDNTGDDTPSTPSKPVTKPTASPAEPEEDLDDPDVPLAELPMQFEDVTEDDWFYEGAKYNFNNNLMKGTSDTQFAPYLNTTRGMIVTILHRVEGEPETEPADFADVEDGMWYTEGVAWGQAEDIALGVEDGTNFLPMVDVTREQMAAFLYRYAQYKGYDVTASGELDDFSDGGDTSDWAVESVRWAIGAGLIEGKGNHILDPKSTATRGEVALILMRFCESFMK